MFRDRNEELVHLIELFQRTSPTIDMEKKEEHFLYLEVESFATVMIKNMLEDKDLDLQFANKVYEFDHQLFLKIFNTAISAVYLQIGFSETLRIVGEVKYFAQVIEGYKTLYDQIKENLSMFHEQSYKLREKLEKMTAMKDFAILDAKEKSHINDMIEVLKPYAILPKPIKSKRTGNWAEHYFLLGHIEKQFEDEKKQFLSLFRTET